MMKTSFRGIIISLIIVGALLVSGCGSANYSTTAGVQINKMEFDFPKISDAEGESVYMGFELQNVGSKQMAGEGRYWIYGPAIKEGTNRNTWTIADKDDLVGTLTMTDFYPPEDGMEGAIIYEYIEFTPPNVPQGMVDASNFNARICYPYTTTSLFKVYSQSVQERASSRRMVGTKQMATDAQKRASSGPIQIDLNTDQEVLLRSDSLRLYFTVSDIGGGFSTKGIASCPTGTSGANVNSIERGKVEVSVMVDGVECKSADKADFEVRIRSGEGNFYCITKGLTDAANDPNHEFTIVAEARYKYWIDSSVPITIEDSVIDDDGIVAVEAVTDKVINCGKCKEAKPLIGDLYTDWNDFKKLTGIDCVAIGCD